MWSHLSDNVVNSTMNRISLFQICGMFFYSSLFFFFFPLHLLSFDRSDQGRTRLYRSSSAEQPYRELINSDRLYLQTPCQGRRKGFPKLPSTGRLMSIPSIEEIPKRIIRKMNRWSIRSRPIESSTRIRSNLQLEQIVK